MIDIILLVIRMEAAARKLSTLTGFKMCECREAIGPLANLGTPSKVYLGDVRLI